MQPRSNFTKCTLPPSYQVKSLSKDRRASSTPAVFNLSCAEVDPLLNDVRLREIGPNAEKDKCTGALNASKDVKGRDLLTHLAAVGRKRIRDRETTRVKESHRRERERSKRSET